MTNLPDLVTMADIARRSGVSRQAVWQWFEGHSDTAPDPVTTVADGTIGLYDWIDIKQWMTTALGRAS